MKRDKNEKKDQGNGKEMKMKMKMKTDKNEMKENENEIGLVDAKSHRYRILVPPGLMDDIVIPLWDCEVYVLGSKKELQI